MKIQFQKLEGAGNDFVVIDNRDRRIKQAARVAKILCDRHRSVGGDGLLLVERSKSADYRMMYYNADGSYGGMCGNGGRCIALFAFLNGLASRRHTFEALGFIYRANVTKAGNVQLHMKDPSNYRSRIVLRGKLGSFLSEYVDTGSPHAVIRVGKGQLQQLDLESIGPWLRHHPAFKPKGANVNFIEMMKDNSLKMRTYERGVEAETLACGTGSIACSLVAATNFGLRSPVTVIAASGDRLKVSFQRQGNQFHRIVLEGPARRVFQGSVDV